MGGEDVVGEVKGVDHRRWALKLRVGGRGVEGIEEARLRLTRSAVAFAMIVLEAVEESRAFGEDMVLIGLR